MKSRPLPVVAATLANACGSGSNAVRMSLQEGRTALRPFDLEWISPMSTWIGRVSDLESVRIPARLAALDSRNNRLAHLCLEQDNFRRHVSSAITRHGSDRIGVFIGTTTSGILDTELAYRAWVGAGAAVSRPDLQRSVHNMHATTAFARRHLGLRGPAQTVSTACSSSAKVFASARRFMEAGLCSAAVVGGVDSLALSTLAGFKALNLVSSGPCRPFDALRDGISIGEGAGFALLDPSADAAILLLGVGESSDAWHMSSPHPEGAGAALAMRMALKEAGLDPSEVGYVNLHGTASRANDLAEDRAITAVFGTKTPVSSTKGFTGHTLGAAGITEAVITAMALADQWIPGTVNCDAVDPELGAALVKESRSQAFAAAMSNSFGFGGTNCSLLFGRMR